MPTKEVERQIAIVFKFGDAWHRGFKLEEQGERHVMLWENCPLHDGPSILFPQSVMKELPPGTMRVNCCVICFADNTW